jgi:hypothetical protein
MVTKEVSVGNRGLDLSTWPVAVDTVPTNTIPITPKPRSPLRTLEVIAKPLFIPKN